MMKFYASFILAASAFQVGLVFAGAQEFYTNLPGETGDQQVSSLSPNISFPRVALENLANLTQQDNLWLLIPSNVSESQLHETEFSLFKLNTGQLLEHEPDNDKSWISLEAQVGPEGLDKPEAGGRLPRAARKLNLFKNMLGKPQVSPLYLVNGTVCRFVNTQPICTTLSTTGLFRGQQSASSFNLFQGNANQQQQQGQLQQQPNQRQVSPQQQQQQQALLSPAQQNGQFGQFRPMAILDNEQQVINVASAGGETNLTARTQQVHRPAGGLNQMRPMNYAIRRPLNLLPLGRPFRTG